ncbi:MAG: flavodoxin domain-containing protein [Bacilli bacterium]|nr:flavodoxin domain-containing protein [Bacilli bacterium]
MKTIVLYTSKTGCAQAYAEEIAKNVGAECCALKKFRKKKLADYDTIIFGGWIRAGVIMGIDDFLQSWSAIEDKNVIVYSVGMAIPSREGRRDLISQNLLDMYHIRYYQLRGSFDFSKLNPIEKMLLKRGLNSSVDSPDNPAGSAILQILDHPVEYYDHEGVDKICSVVRALAVVDVTPDGDK